MKPTLNQVKVINGNVVNKNKKSNHQSPFIQQYEDGSRKKSKSTLLQKKKDQAKEKHDEVKKEQELLTLPLQQGQKDRPVDLANLSINEENHFIETETATIPDSETDRAPIPDVSEVLIQDEPMIGAENGTDKEQAEKKEENKYQSTKQSEEKKGSGKTQREKGIR